MSTKRNSPAARAGTGRAKRTRQQQSVVVALHTNNIGPENPAVRYLVQHHGMSIWRARWLSRTHGFGRDE